MIYCFEIRKPGSDESELIEFAAPSADTALMLIISQWPGVHIVQIVGSYVEGAKGEA